MAKTLKYKDINLIAAQDRRQKAAKEERVVAVRQPALILILVLLLLGLGYYRLYTATNELEDEKKRLTGYLEDPITIEDYNSSITIQESAIRMVAQKDELANVLLNLSGCPDMQGGDFHLIYGYAGDSIKVSGVAYDRNSGVLSFMAASETVTGVPIFVAQLRTSAVFADIRYEGYSEQVQTFSQDLTPKKEPRLDEYGNHVINPLTEELVYDLIPQSRTYTVKAYQFAITALVKAPEPRMPGPGEGLYGGGNQ
jgi:hypothetical protein